MDPGKFLLEFGFKNGCPGAPVGDEAVEAVVEGDSSFNLAVDDGFHQFP